MGLSGISPGSLILIFLIVVLLFGTKKLQTVGEDLGKALKGFRKGLREAQEEEPSNKKTDV
ncbi:MAG: Sec-independent protein translocase TatA [Gammaproteobacteria bacterium 39-13]|nr:twin-arginine translocase TatA/TatE family subunit [Gammaproteobacteria bacterium]OJV90561.1 MAG: Sec-independent protein translocase TatA [Gammaproteobacteria bacterium 39-13]